MNDITAISDICQKAIEPLSNKLNVFVESLATKDDLQNILITIQDNVTKQISDCLLDFQREIELRDAKILSLENNLANLTEAYDEVGNQLKTVVSRIEDLECNVRGRQETSPQLNDDDENEDIENDEIEDDEEEEKEILDFACVGDSIVRLVNIDAVNPGCKNKLVCQPGATISTIRSSIKELDEDST